MRVFAGRPEERGRDEPELSVVIQEVLEKALGRPIEVTRCKRELSPFATLFPVEIVSVTFGRGESLSLFLKHLGPEQADHPDKQRRDREVRVYEELLCNTSLPVVRFYGSRWNEGTKRQELFLEYVDDWKLKYHKLEHWFTAARRMAQLHAYFSERADELFACDFLLRLDATYLCAWADRALGAVANESETLARRLEPILKDYSRVAELVANQPPTLVHNDLSAKNVIASRSTNPARICLVDWEMAGVGCGVLDVAHLIYNRLDDVNERRVCATYCEELAGTRLLPTESGGVARLFAACELHTTLYRIAHSKAWGEPVEYRAERVARACEIWSRL